jgi:uncharacterized membrane protein HdeD (DUF308 family)
MKEKTETMDVKSEKKNGRKFLAGIIVIIVGIGLLLQNLFPWFSFNYVIPVIIIVIGIALILRGSR